MTRLLSSNIVKWNYIHFDNEEKHVIDSDSRKGLLAELLSVPKETIDSAFEKKEKEKQVEEEKKLSAEQALAKSRKELEEEKKRFEEEKEKIIIKAKLDAEQIINLAESQAEIMKTAAYEEGKNTGYAEGKSQAEEEIAREWEMIHAQKQENEEEYARILNETEPRFVDIMIGLIQKITGVVIADKREVILHLVHSGILQIGRSKQYNIHCSKEDYMLLEKEKGNLYEAIGRTDGIEIIEDNTLQKNQCMIETDKKILDCSLDVQLNNLIETIQLLDIE